MYPDFLTCGRCADEYPLSRIDDFILHKTSCLQALGVHNYDGLGTSTVLTCFICQQDFRTARGVLQHVQYVHHMDVFLHKSPLSVDHVFLAHDKQAAQPVNSAATTNRCTAENVTGPNVATATTFTDNRSTTVTHISDNVEVSPSKRSELPMTCAKLAASEGTTICCNGKECQVTINPPAKVAPPKKCCSSVVPKKRTRHMQEHDSEDMEQCALETLASFRGRFLLNQKSRSCQKKATSRTSRSSRRSKSKCIMRCEREAVLCVKKKLGACEEEETAACSREEDDHDEVCIDADSDLETETKTQTIELYSIEKDCVTSRKTVVVNSGVTVTLEPTETATSRKKQGGQVPLVMQAPTSAPQNQNQSLPNLDASRESAQILAELMYHATSPHLDQALSMPMSVQNMPASAADAHASLISLAEAPVTNPLSESADTNFLPPNITFSSTSAISFGDTFNPIDVNSNIPNPLDVNANVPMSKVLGPLTVSPQMDMHQLNDLDALTTSIRLFDSLDQVSSDSSTLAAQDMPFSLGSGSDSLRLTEGGAGERDRKQLTSGKKRRYPTSRPYKCGECDQAFNQPIHLKKHMSKHTGVKPFKCEKCEYSTVERSHLKAHDRIHTGEKPFRCQFCSYATAQNSTLKVHLRRHHQDKQAGAAAATLLAGQQGLQQNHSD